MRSHRPLKIALLTHSVNPRGGVVHTLELGSALVAAGHDVTIFAPASAGQTFFRATPCKISFAAISGTQHTLVDMVSLRIDAYVRHFTEILERESFDIFHAQDSISGNALADLRTRGLIGEFVRTVHHLDEFDEVRLQTWQSRAWREASQVLCVSELWCQHFAEHYAVRAALVSNGVDAERFTVSRNSDAPHPPRFLAVGGVEERKNTLRILEAFVQVRRVLPTAQLVIAGGASLLNHDHYAQAFQSLLKTHALDTGTDAAVHLAGPITDDAMPALFRRATALLMPSLKEGFGLVVLEALASGTPVVASRIAPFTEYLSDACCHWADPLSTHSIADAMLRASSGVRGERLRELASGLIDRMSWTASAERHIEIYRAFIDKATSKNIPETHLAAA